MKKLLFTPFLFLFLLGIDAQTTTDNQEDWFPFSPKYNSKNSVFEMTDWLDAPAGKHGFLKFENENLVFEDGTPVKFWGTNICSSLPYVEAEMADSFVNYLANYGNNAVRFHKFTWSAYSKDKSTVLQPEKYERFDYFQSKLREKGMYYGWSHIYGHKVLPGDSSKLVAYSEVKNLNYPWAHLNGTTSSLVNFAPDLQDLNIELTINMLNHVNPHTGLRYADDPALIFIEFQNEDDIFWAAIKRSLEQAPTYKAMLCKQFSGWLKEKYKTQEKLVESWGAENIPDRENLEKENIFPDPDHGLFSREYMSAKEEDRPMARHILDKMKFLHETQLNFYKKFEKAIRETGYKGVLVGSCWQAGSGISHYYNLHTDYEMGMIDRHNYFGGGEGGHRLKEGRVRNQTMISRPGSGLLSAGLQQIADRPFSFSEWMSLVPNEWTAEATALIAIYGMGLQGWDASFSFATDIPRFSRLLESERHGVYNATSPLHMGLYPALARMVYRNDVKESPIMATRNVHVPSMGDGKLGFEEIVRQGYDDKDFTGTVSPGYIAIGRFPAKFTETYEETVIPSVDKYWDNEAKTIKSVTEELEWHYSENPFATLNTSSTKAVVGFAENQEIELGDWKISTNNKFAVILVTSLDKKDDLENADQILVAAVSRARNTGMVYEYEGNRTTLKERGTMPLLMEPVNMNISIKNNQKYQVEVLDHDGVPTGEIISGEDNTFMIDGAKHKTLYYLLTKK